MPQELFRFLQVELPFDLRAPDGRWLIRDARGGEVERVLVLRTVGSTRADVSRRPHRRRHLPRADPPGTEPHAVPISRATMVDPAPLANEQDAQAWLEGLDPSRASVEAFAWLNKLLRAQRIAAADPYAHELGPEDALVLRAGFGAGEQVAEGRWAHARPLASAQLDRRGRRRKAMRQAHTEARLAALLGGRANELLCEELALRARLDLDQGRPKLAAIELRQAYAAAIAELGPRQPGGAPLTRRAELESLYAKLETASETPGELGEPELLHALTRLEAALRARAVLEPGC